MGCESPDAAIFIAHSFRQKPRAGHYAQSSEPRPCRTPLAGGRSRAFVELLRGRRSLLATPTEFAAIRPHAMQDHRELARDRYRRAAQATPLGKRGAPSLQRRPSGDTGQQAMRGNKVSGVLTARFDGPRRAR